MKLVIRIDAILKGRFQTLFQKNVKFTISKKIFGHVIFHQKLALHQNYTIEKLTIISANIFAHSLAYVAQTFGIGLIFDEKSHGRFFRNFKLFPKKV